MPIRRMTPPVLLVLGVILLWGIAGCRKPPTVAESIALANAKLDAGEVEAALLDLQKLDTANPGTPTVVEALAFAYAQAGQHRAAGETFLRRARMDFDGAQYFLYAGSALVQAGMRATATLAYREYLQAFPEDAATWATLGRLLDESGNPTEAVEAYLVAHAARPDAGVAGRLGDLFLRLGNAAQAEAWFQKAREGGPDHAPAALVGLLETALLARRPAEAERWMQELDREHPRYLDQSASAARRGEIQAWRKAQDEAEALLARQREELLRRQAEEEEARRRAEEEAARLAEEARRQAEEQEAAAVAGTPEPEAGSAATTDAGQTGANRPPSPLAATLFAEADRMTAAGDLDGAFVRLQEALGLYPDDARLWAALAENALVRADLRWAEAAALEALRLDPTLPPVRRAWTLVSAATLPPDRFLDELAALRRRFPEDPDLTLALARALRDQGGPRSMTAQLYQEFLRLAPPRHPERPQAEAELADL